MSRELGRLKLSLTLTQRQIWLAQSPLSEPCRKALHSLTVVPGQLFGPAAQQTLERSLQVTHIRQQFSSLRHASIRGQWPTMSGNAPQPTTQTCGGGGVNPVKRVHHPVQAPTAEVLRGQNNCDEGPGQGLSWIIPT